ncbi:FUSC family protein [Sinosporangium siamense]|nr:FUSC family protein [Sinosporangium siamense]
MRKVVRALRAGYTLPSRPPWAHGLVCGIAVAVPLLVGALLGRPHEGATMALGAYLVAFGDASGIPYGARSRRLLRLTLFVTLGVAVGELVTPVPWLAVVVLGLLAVAGARWAWIGLPPVLGGVLTFFEGFHPEEGLRLPLTALGGLLLSVLVLAPWPTRRMRPLREAFDTAFERLADLIEAGAGDPLPDEQWQRLRRAASDALDDAKTAYAYYSAPTAALDRAPERLMQALVRVFDETVALRGLRSAAGEKVKSTAWRVALDRTMTAQADALRGLARGGGPGIPAEALAHAAGLAAETENVRARARAGRERLTASANLGQVLRSADRLVLAVRAAASLAAESVRFRPGLPRLPRPAWGWWGRGEGDHAVRLGAITAVAVAVMVGIHGDFGKWFVLTVLVSLRPTYGDTVDRVTLRIAGTALGSVAAAVLLALAPGPYTLVAIVFVAAAIGFALRAVSYGYWAIFSTPLVMLLSDYATPLGWEAAEIRVLLTVGGGLLALIGARLLWPHGERVRLPPRVADMLDAHAALARALAGQRVAGFEDLVDQAARAAGRVTESLDRLAKEPGGKAPEALRSAVAYAGRVRDDTLTLAAVQRASEAGSGRASGMLDAVADRLEGLAHAVRTGEEPPPADDLDEALEELASRVDTLAKRRRGELAEGRAEQMTSVRRELLFAAAAHPALRTLGADTVKLSAAISRGILSPRV